MGNRLECREAGRLRAGREFADRPQHPQAMAEGGLPVSAANMAFYDAHKAQLHQHMQSVAREQLKANGGKLPACLAE